MAAGRVDRAEADAATVWHDHAGPGFRVRAVGDGEAEIATDELAAHAGAANSGFCREAVRLTADRAVRSRPPYWIFSYAAVNPLSDTGTVMSRCAASCTVIDRLTPFLSAVSSSGETAWPA